MQLNEIIQHTEKLSPQMQAEVFDFILHLEKKQAAQLLSAQQRKQRLKKALDNAVALTCFCRTFTITSSQTSTYKLSIQTQRFFTTSLTRRRR